MRELLLGFGLCILMISAVSAQDGTRMLHQPDISADGIVFVYAGDLDGRDPQLERAVEVVLERLQGEGYTKTPRPRYPNRSRGGIG